MIISHHALQGQIEGINIFLSNYCNNNVHDGIPRLSQAGAKTQAERQDENNVIRSVD
jgi:hypothetical protein